jgi:anti-sigma28 factor (negative regulator of flagellin synthesis)
MGVVGAIIGGVASIGSALIGGSAQSSASETAANATSKANADNIAFQKWLYGDQKTQAQPWYTAGVDAVKQLQEAINNGTYNLDTSKLNQTTFDPNSVNPLSDPSFKFRMQQGVNALDMSAASKGRLQSGAQDKAITQYGQDFASQEYTNAYNRGLQTNNANNATNLNSWNAQSAELNNRYNRLAGLSGTGQTANNTIANAGQNMGSAVGQSTLNTGNAIATNAINQGNVSANMWNNVGSSINSGINNYMTLQALEKNGGK